MKQTVFLTRRSKAYFLKGKLTRNGHIYIYITLHNRLFCLYSPNYIDPYRSPFLSCTERQKKAALPVPGGTFVLAPDAVLVVRDVGAAPHPADTLGRLAPVLSGPELSGHRGGGLF